MLAMDLLKQLQVRAERRAIMAEAFMAVGNEFLARVWAKKADETWAEWVAAVEAEIGFEIKIAV